MKFLGLLTVIILFTISAPEAQAKKSKKSSTKHRAAKVVKNKPVFVNDGRRYVYNSQLAKKAENKIKGFVKELSRAKTVKDWINKSHRKSKYVRRVHFSRYMKQKIPKFIKGRFSVALYNKGLKEDPLMLSVFPGQLGIRLLINGEDVTPKKGESYKKWLRRRSSKHPGRSAQWMDLFISKAFAEFNTDALYSNIFTLSLSDDWEGRSFNEGTYNDDEFQRLVADARELRESHGLVCRQRWAVFNTELGGKSQTVAVMPQKKGSGMLEAQLLSSPTSTTALGMVSVRSDGYHSYVTDAQGNRYNAQTMYSALNTIIAGQGEMPAQINRWGDDRSTGGDVVGSYHNLRACIAATNAGADISMCSAESPSHEYEQCIRDNAIQGRLQKNYFNGRNPSAVSGMDRMSAVALKVELASIYARGYSTRVNNPAQSRRGQSSYTYVGAAGMSQSAFLEALSMNQDDEALHQQAIDCFNQSVAGQNCSGGMLPQSMITNIQRLAYTMRPGIVSTGPSLSEIQEDTSQLMSNAPAACRGLMNNKRRESLADLANLDGQLTDANQNLASQVDLMTTKADVANSCCGNAQCRSALHGTGVSRPAGGGVGTDN